jgi:hypothetical protein
VTTCQSRNNTDKEREELYSILRHILGCIIILFSPLSADSLSTLLYSTEEGVDRTLEDLYAILDILEDQTRPIPLHHPSFRKFLLDKTRSGDPKFWVDKKQAHLMLADSYIRLISNLR